MIGSLKCDALRDFVAFVHFKKREDTNSGVLLLIKLHGCFPRFLNCTNGTKLHKTSVLLRCSLSEPTDRLQILLLIPYVF